MCAIKLMLGFDCPGCGLLHSLLALAHGQILASLDAHPMGVIVFAWCFWVAAFRLIRQPVSAKISEWFSRALLVGLAVNWFAKIYFAIS